jgi:hypothetical protein
MGLAGRATDSTARKLGQDGSLGTETTARGSIDTLRVSDAGDTQSRVVKAASGGNATVFPRSSGPGLRELKTQEGIGVPRGLNHRSTLRTTVQSKTLRSTRWSLAPGNRQAAVANGARVTVTGEVMRLGGGNNPWSENPGHGSAMKQARKARGGANRRERAKRWGRNIGGLGMPAGKWTPRTDVVKRDETPREAPAAATRAGR